MSCVIVGGIVVAAAFFVAWVVDDVAPRTGIR